MSVAPARLAAQPTAVFRPPEPKDQLAALSNYIQELLQSLNPYINEPFVKILHNKISSMRGEFAYFSDESADVLNDEIGIMYEELRPLKKLTAECLMAIQQEPGIEFTKEAFLNDLKTLGLYDQATRAFELREFSDYGYSPTIAFRDESLSCLKFSFCFFEQRSFTISLEEILKAGSAMRAYSLILQRRNELLTQLRRDVFVQHVRKHRAYRGMLGCRPAEEELKKHFYIGRPAPWLLRYSLTAKNYIISIMYAKNNFKHYLIRPKSTTPTLDLILENLNLQRAVLPQPVTPKLNELMTKFRKAVAQHENYKGALDRESAEGFLDEPGSFILYEEKNDRFQVLAIKENKSPFDIVHICIKASVYIPTLADALTYYKQRLSIPD